MSHIAHSSSPLLASPMHTPPSRPTRPRLSRGISSRKLATPPVPPSLRDHPLLDVVAHGSCISTPGIGTPCSGPPSCITSPASVPSSRRSSISASSPLARPLEKLPLPSPTNLWALPPRPSPPISGPWSSPCQSEPVADAMGLLDTVPAGSTVSVATHGGYPWHTAPGTACSPGHGRAQGYEYMSLQLGLHHPSRRHPPPAHHLIPAQPDDARTPTSGQRHNVGSLHTHSPRPSPPMTPAAA
ncbi:hypothetical protein CTheo_80 [Ceratobasidium theobromae]|uniref:Uncharacterized protein n=1 Tax=Ceratobasidium theobromae TaxID=1582974 RepID=A0A5N5QY21_9AGAM|nr:hypothetical protein CTheo_80 [Ceratobasidium theobromae]